MKNLLLLISMAVSALGYSQISVRAEESRLDKVVPIIDSTQNITEYKSASQFLGLINTKVYVYPTNPKYTYKAFNVNNFDGSDIDRQDYERLIAGKYFIVEDVIFIDRFANKNVLTAEQWEDKRKKEKGFVGEKKLVLKSVETNQKYITGYHFGDILPVIYYEYLEKRYLNKDITHSFFKDNIKPLEQVLTEPEEINESFIFKVKKMELIQKDNARTPNIVFTLESRNGEASNIYDRYLYGKLGIDTYFPLSEYQSFLNQYREYRAKKVKHYEDIDKKEKAERYALLKKKYGSEIAKVIVEGKVKIGMSKEMCKDAWGEPKDINKTTTKYSVSEQWVYDIGSYLYFENGKLTTIQN